MKSRLLHGFFVVAAVLIAGSRLPASADTPQAPAAAPAVSTPAASAVPDGFGFTWSSPPTAAESKALVAPPAADKTTPQPATAATLPPPAAAAATEKGAGASPAGPDKTKPAEIKTPDDKSASAPAPKPGVLSSDSGDYQYEAVPAGGTPSTPETVLPGQGAGHKPMIAIVIDDMGVDRKHSARALKLPAAVTMSYLPYSAQIKEQTAAAVKAGHELMVHMPMQPDNKTLDPGPNYLGIDMSPLELHDRVIKNLAAFSGYHEVNNHMGSKFTANREGLNVVMAVLAERKLMFLDSRTAPDSIAETVAREHHLQTTHRDIFIDNDDKHAAAVAAELVRTEKVARHTGAAIAIGHPKDITLDALEKWLPTLKAKGFDIVPLSTVIALRDPKPAANKPAPSVAQPAIKMPPETKKAEAPAAAAIAPETKTAPVAAAEKGEGDEKEPGL